MSLRRQIQYRTSTPKEIARLNNNLMEGMINPEQVGRELRSDEAYCKWAGATGAFYEIPITTHERYVVNGEAEHRNPDIPLYLGSLSVIQVRFPLYTYGKDKGVIKQSVKTYEGPLVVADLTDSSGDTLSQIAVSYPLNNPDAPNRLNRATFFRAQEPDNSDLFSRYL